MDRIKYAQARVDDNDWATRRARSELETARYYLGLSTFRRYVWQTLFAAAGAVATVWYVLQIPTAIMDTGGNWAVGMMVVTVFAVVLAVVAGYEARSDQRYRPTHIANLEAKIARLAKELPELEATVAHEKAEHERLRRQPAALMTLTTLLGNDALGRLEATGVAADELVAAELRAVLHGYDKQGWDELARRVGQPRANALRDANDAYTATRRAD